MAGKRRPADGVDVLTFFATATTFDANAVMNTAKAILAVRNEQDAPKAARPRKPKAAPEA